MAHCPRAAAEQAGVALVGYLSTRATLPVGAAWRARPSYICRPCHSRQTGLHKHSFRAKRDCASDQSGELIRGVAQTRATLDSFHRPSTLPIQQSVARRLPSPSSHGACEGAMPCDAGTCGPPWGRRGCKRGEERGAARGSTEARRCGACQGALSRAALPRAAWAAARRGAAQVPSDGHMRRHRAAARPIAACRAERRGCFAGKP